MEHLIGRCCAVNAHDIVVVAQPSLTFAFALDLLLTYKPHRSVLLVEKCSQPSIVHSIR